MNEMKQSKPNDDLIQNKQPSSMFAVVDLFTSKVAGICIRKNGVWRRKRARRNLSQNSTESLKNYFLVF